MINNHLRIRSPSSLRKKNITISSGSGDDIIVDNSEKANADDIIMCVIDKKASSLLLFIVLMVLSILGFNIGSRLGNMSFSNAEYDAIIVGGGWAGIRAAQTLIDAGIDNILLLEAADYVGGRSKTMNTDGSINKADKVGDLTNIPLEFGSEWLYTDGRGSEMKNYLYERRLLDAIDLDDKDALWLSAYEQPGTFIQSINSNTGAITTDAMLDEEVTTLRNQVWMDFVDFKDKLEDDHSYYTAAEQYKIEAGLNERERNYLDLVIDIAEIDYIGESKDIDASSHSHDGEAYQTHYMGYRGVGYGNVAAQVASPIMPFVSLNSKVTHVDQENGQNIVVKYLENGETKQATTRAILVTVSLGVLKAGTINFTPNLPQGKQEAIDGMGFGSMNKIVLQWYNETDLVWPKDKLWFNLITPAESMSRRWTTWYSPHKYKTKPILIGWCGGDDAKYMETQTDEEVLNDAMTNLHHMFPTIKSPDRILISRWGKEEHIRGTYSFGVVNRSFTRDMSTLGERHGNVWFAGEATSGRSWQGTTVGAWLTGEQKAREIIAHLQL